MIYLLALCCLLLVGVAFFQELTIKTKSDGMRLRDEKIAAQEILITEQRRLIEALRLRRFS